MYYFCFIIVQTVLEKKVWNEIIKKMLLKRIEVATSRFPVQPHAAAPLLLPLCLNREIHRTRARFVILKHSFLQKIQNFTRVVT